MTFLLDTSVAIHLRDRDPNVLEKLDALSGPFVLSVISRIELENGVYRGREVSAARRGRLDLLLSAIEVLPFDDLTADAYSAILAAVGYSRRKVVDRMIAAQAIAHQATLVTRNGDDFRDVPGLAMLEW